VVSLKNMSAPAVVDEAGIIFAGGDDWILYAYQAEAYIHASEFSNTAPVIVSSAKGTYGVNKYITLMADPNNAYFDSFIYNDRDLSAMLNDIESVIRRGGISGDEKMYISFLMKASAGASAIAGTGAFRAYTKSEQRIKAVRLLGAFGSRETIPFLIELFRREKDTWVKCAICDALGAIGTDPELLVMRTFAEELSKKNIYSEEILVESIVRSVSGICLFSGPVVSASGVPLLNSIAGNSIFKTASQAAVEALEMFF
jgi:outer membrane protein assembly factor BamB